MQQNSKLSPLDEWTLISRIYWGIVDKKQRQVVSFVREAGCFNIHILNETIKAPKTKNGMVAIHLDKSKAFDTVPHAAIECSTATPGTP